MRRPALARTIEGYIARRTPVRDLPLSISRRRLYILPTRGGALFAVLLVVMLLGATNYGNSLGFALAFWLAAAALVSMHRAHRNLLGLRVEQISAEPLFAGGTAVFVVVLSSQAHHPRRSLRVRFDGHRGPVRMTDVTDRGDHCVTLEVAAPHRGHLTCPALHIETRYPLGLFRAWSRIAPAASALVYPRPLGRTAVAHGAGTDRGDDRRLRRGGEEFFDHRRYRPGDAPRHIDWKASARSPDLLVRDHAMPHAPTRWFDYHALSGMTPEARLSQLTLWVCRAERDGHRYGLRLPQRQFAPSRGAAHYSACLRALALF